MDNATSVLFLKLPSMVDVSARKTMFGNKMEDVS